MENELKNSEKFIRKTTGKKTGFSVPSNYFEEIEDSFAIHLFEDVQPKESSFETPLNYFDTLEDKIVSQIPSEKKSFKSKVIQLIPFATAACLLLFIALNSFIFADKNSVNFDSIATQDIDFWYDSGYSTIENNDLEIVFEDVDFEENDFTFTTISDHSLENYIYSTNDATLLNELY